MEGSRLVAISGLLQCRRPISGTFSVPSFDLSAPARPPSTDSARTDASCSSSTGSRRVLISLSDPCLIVGTLNLPVFSDESSSPNSSCHHSCLTFSDGSASVCCDVVDFNLGMVGKEVRVLAWNFIPLKNHGGLLEIIKWEFSSDSNGLNPGLCSCDMGSIRLDFGSTRDAGDASKNRYSLFGLLDSVSPITVVPCAIDHEGKKTLRGFIVQILACCCKLCQSGDSSDFFGKMDRHCFTDPKFVYFVGSGASWHPAITKLVGKIISLSRLRKKLICLGKEEKEIMFVTVDRTCLHFSNLPYKRLLGRPVIKGSTQFGAYIGIVRGVHVNGLVFELDEDVWLLLTDQLLIPPHSIRVGAMITVKNVHFVNPEFYWANVLVLGSCYKTSISITSFSPLETG